MRQLSARCGALIAVASFLVSPGAAQEQASPPQLVPGGADVIHDADGFSIGMKCVDAFALAKRRGLPHPPDMRPWLGSVKLYGRAVSFRYQELRIYLRDPTSRSTDDIIARCLDDNDATIYYLFRGITFNPAVEAAPKFGSLRELVQQKYGIPSFDLQGRSFAIIFNTNGFVDHLSNDCGNVGRDWISQKDFNTVDLSRCSYSLVMNTNEASGYPGTVGHMRIEIRDYVRFNRDLRILEQRRQVTMPSATPRL